jgi:hypothetical protein
LSDFNEFSCYIMIDRYNYLGKYYLNQMCIYTPTYTCIDSDTPSIRTLNIFCFTLNNNYYLPIRIRTQQNEHNIIRHLPTLTLPVGWYITSIEMYEFTMYMYFKRQ